MPLLDDIMDNRVLGREIRRGIQIGKAQGFQDGELNLVRRQIEKRFGAIPVWAQEKLTGFTAPELEAVGLRLLDTKSLEDLLG